jgi:hypothetical protein
MAYKYAVGVKGLKSVVPIYTVAFIVAGKIMALTVYFLVLPSSAVTV